MNPKLNRIYKQLTADKKKLSVMVGLLGVAMLLWGRLLLEKVPRTATAEPAIAVTQSASADLSSGPIVIHPVVWIDPAPALDRDLFALNPTAYQRVAAEPTETVRVAKSDLDPADELRAAQAVREAANRLTLQSILGGSRPVAMINGQLLATGQTIEGFTVSRIDQRHVLLTKAGVSVRLEMD